MGEVAFVWAGEVSSYFLVGREGNGMWWCTSRDLTRGNGNDRVSRDEAVSDHHSLRRSHTLRGEEDGWVEPHYFVDDGV